MIQQISYTWKVSTRYFGKVVAFVIYLFRKITREQDRKKRSLSLAGKDSVGQIFARKPLKIKVTV